MFTHFIEQYRHNCGLLITTSISKIRNLEYAVYYTAKTGNTTIAIFKIKFK